MEKKLSDYLFFVITTIILLVSTNSYCDDNQQEVSDTDLTLNIGSLLIQAVKNHEEIKSFADQVEILRAQHSQSKGLYYPTVNLTADGGQESIDKEFATDTNETRYNVNLRANQLITDFGKTKYNIERSGVLLRQAEMTLESTRQRITLEGITAYLNIIRARERLKSARQSESRIKELTGIEKTLVEKGAGLSSDVLQAKSQLSGAMALRVEAEGELNLAKNRFEAVFYRSLNTQEISELVDIDFPYDKLPLELKNAIDIALKKNPELLITMFNIKVAQTDINIAKTKFYPQLNLFANAISKNNDAGTIGYSNELSAGLEFRYNIFNGGVDKSALRAALSSKKSASNHTNYVKRIITEQVSNSWDQLTILNMRTELLDQQAEIVKTFLDLAKKERTMGTRSLLDVLNGEINYINATATSIAARQDTKIAAFNLIYSMGQINLDLF